jgi:hypothetical protein
MKRCSFGKRTIVRGALFGLGLLAISCSALLDTEELQQGSQDGGNIPDGIFKDFKPHEDTGADVYSIGLLPRNLYPTPSAKRLALAPTKNGNRSLSLSFHWDDVPGQPADVDLSLEQKGKDAPVFQVFAKESRPFVRAGLRIIPIQPSMEYQLALSREATSSEITLALSLPAADLSEGRTIVLEEKLPAAMVGDELILALGKTDQNKTRVIVKLSNTKAGPLALERSLEDLSSLGLTLASVR